MNPENCNSKDMYSEYTEDNIFLKIVGKKHKRKHKKHRKRSMKVRNLTRHKISSENINGTDSLSRDEGMRLPGIVEYANWMDHVCDSIVNYTQDQIIEAEIMLKDYQICLLPEKRALEAIDGGFARKVTHMENMFKEMLVILLSTVCPQTHLLVNDSLSRHK